MALEDLETEVNTILKQEWDVRDGQVVPTTEDVALTGGAVKLTATMLYADLADSTELAMYDRRVAAKTFKCFLTCCSRLIRERGGRIRSFDGDRVMGVFLGSSPNTSAAKCALNINYVFLNIIKPKLEAKYAAFSDGTYKLAHCVGIDTSGISAVRSGIRNNNDLIWVGRSPNIAAKLSSLRDSPYHSFITDKVYDLLHGTVKTTDGKTMWEKRIWKGGVETVYRSSWTWKP